MIAQGNQRGRLSRLLGMIGVELGRADAREDGLTQSAYLNDKMTVSVTAAAEDTAIVTIVTDTATARELLRTVGRTCGIVPLLRGH